ncbi:MAG TPA: hypothetical protein VJ987_15285, partial [Anaerolineales bacterium]|nr:hypothetical protein [Anaerolineales bacterium]
MSISAGVTVVIVIFALLALLAARAGIRSIQASRVVVFYRTRRARMVAGWQWLGTSFVLGLVTVAVAIFGQPVANRMFSPAPISPVALTSTPLPTAALLPQPVDTNTP